MMGDRNYRDLIQNAVDSIGKELDIQIDAEDIKTVHLAEAVQCMRRSYYDRVEPQHTGRGGFNELLAGMLRKLHYGVEAKDFAIDDIKLRGQADMMVDDAIILFRSATAPPKNPNAGDLLYLNACMWIYGKLDGIIIYITGDRQEASFSLTRNRKMFEETVRRVRVLHNLLEDKKTPILEPSEDCASCPYYSKCYIREKVGKSISLMSLMGMDKEKP